MMPCSLNQYQKSKIKLLNLAAKLFYKIFMTPSNLDISLTNADIKNIIEFTESFPVVYTLDEAIAVVENGHIQLDFVDLGHFNGLLCERKKEYFMCVNIMLDDNYKTKTILHELGHYMIHYNNRFRKLFFCHDMMVSHEEKEADYFAWWLMDDYLRERCKWNFFCLKL